MAARVAQEGIETGKFEVAGQSADVVEALEEIAHDGVLKMALSSILIVKDAY